MTFTWFDKLTDILELVPDMEDRKTLAYAFVMYGSEGEEPELGYPLNALFEAVRSDLDNTREAHANGKRGGRPKKTQVSGVSEVEEPQEELVSEVEKPQEEGVSKIAKTPIEENGERVSETPGTIRKEKERKDRKDIGFPPCGKPDAHGEGSEEPEELVAPPGEPKPDPIPYGDIVDALNERTGRSYRASTPKTRQLIRARWAEGFRVEDFRRVIDGQAAKWMGDPEMERYLRPETLFGTKFEGYLQAAPKTRPKAPELAESSMTPEEELAEWDVAHSEWLEGGGPERARGIGSGTSTLTPAQFEDITLAAERDRLAMRVG